jgi:very-short-patch-repair endonuclease
VGGEGKGEGWGEGPVDPRSTIADDESEGVALCSADESLGICTVRTNRVKARRTSMSSSTERPISPQTENARRLRRNATIPERMLWNRLRGGRLAGLKFRRQQPIAPFIVDFYCHEVGLAVEVDGRSHDERGKEDARREAFLRERQRLQVLRVGNDDVLKETEAVLIAILRAAGKDTA